MYMEQSLQMDKSLIIFYGKNFPFPLVQVEQSCQLLAKKWALNTGKLPLGGLPRNILDKKLTIKTSAVYCGC